MPSLTPLEVAANTPPARLTAAIISSDSTANCPETALIPPRAFSKSLALILNCLNIAIAPSAVLLISVKVGAKVDLAKASRDF